MDSTTSRVRKRRYRRSLPLELHGPVPRHAARALANALSPARGCPVLALPTTCTLLRGSQQRNRRKPHQQERYTPPTFLHCFLKSVCSRFTYANTRGKSAGFRRGMMSPCGSTPIRPITVRLSLAPSSRTRRPFGFSCESLASTQSAGETTGLPRSAAVTVWVMSLW